MRIRRLELIGFKSFPFATPIEFPPEGITAIVGPNGCGKSNLLDALLWVMGATSSKLLRSRSMEDVIFSGAEGLEPLGRAEVRLTLDNSMKLACEPYREIPEIEIRRVVYRDGESEFWMNGRRCRLRDIQEFFLGTGLGANSYAIIEQGKVDAVILARPEDRRLYLDESAGISKYKERREIALRKMEATKQNLSRVEDVLGEVKRQANRLKRQAAKARRFQRLKQKLDTLLIERAKQTLRDMEKEEKVLREALQNLTRQEGAKEAEWRSLDARVSDLQARLFEREEQLRTLNVAYTHQRDVLTERRQALFVLREKRGRMEEMQKGLRETFRDAEKRRASLLSQAENLSKEVTSLEEALRERERVLKEKTAEYEAERERLTGLENEIERLKQAVFEAMEAEVDAKNRLVQLTERIKDTRRGIERREGELKKARARLQSLDQALAGAQSELERLERDQEEQKARKAVLEASLTRAAERERQVKDALRNLEKELTECRSSLTSLLEIQKNMEDVSSKGAKILLRQFFNRRESRTFGGRLMADTIEVESPYDRALEAILRDELEFVLVDNHETALEGLAFLKEKNAGRSGLIPRDALQTCPEDPKPAPYPDLEPLLSHVQAPREGKRVVECLLKGVWVVESYDRAVEIQKRNGFSGTLVTLEGDVFYPNGVMVGGGDEPGTRNRVARNRKIAALNRKVQVLEDERRRHGAIVEQAEKERAELQDRSQILAERLRRVDLEFATLRKEMENTEKERARAQQQMNVLETELETMRQRLKATQRKREEARRSHEEARQKQAAMRADLGDREQGIRSLRATVERKGEEVNRLRVEEAGVREKHQSRLQKLTTLKREVAELSREMDRKRQREGEIENQLDEIVEQISVLDRTIKDAEGSLSKLKEKIEVSELELRKEKEALRTLEKRKAEGLKILQTLKEEVAEKKLKLTQQDMEIETLIKEASARFQVDLRNLVSEGKQDETGGEAAIRELERKLAGMGEINFVAVQEFEELKERLTFLEQQQADLLEAIQTLTETIQRINRATSTRFKETYEKVQRYFSELFVKLFGGGKGELRLTDPANYRETGIEIFAKPPGKRLQPIRLLSGGEKALVAIAFLFAMYLTRPSPFCVMDEVDAPLDEGNIDRFNRLITEWSDQSQFILITHNKRTMACAQSLLGITMEQPGISKIVSVSLGEVAP